MDRMRDHSVAIVEQVNTSPLILFFDIDFRFQALLVSQELIRVAILWHELWHEGLQEASRLYYTDKNPEGMIAVLERLHDMLEEVRTLYLTYEFLVYILIGSQNNSRNNVRPGFRSRSS